eukprot:1649684-Prymnesium_polylepis.2
MDVEEFGKRFAMLYSCRVLRTTLDGGRWHLAVLANEWCGERAGGCANHGSATWGCNPQAILRCAAHKRSLAAPPALFPTLFPTLRRPCDDCVARA